MPTTAWRAKRCPVHTQDLNWRTWGCQEAERANLTTVPPGQPQGCSFLPLLFDIVLEVLTNAVKQEKEIKGIQIEKEEIKLSLFADHMTVYKENIKESTKKILELKSNNSKIAEYKVNIQKSITFLYTSNELGIQNLKHNAIYTSTKKMSYLSINLTKNIQDLYAETTKF
uniref:Reverse transcriptase domain-containing protein n=1 Tax=Equus asinus TaxID=9793 RepID=A0A9L0I7Q7_EQUAS